MIGRILSWFGTDGLAHIIVSAVLLLILQVIFPWDISVLVTLFIGITKEMIYDKWMKNGTPQWKDIICDIVGIVIGCMGYL